MEFANLNDMRILANRWGVGLRTVVRTQYQRSEASWPYSNGNIACATGAKLFRCSGVGPRRASASRCSAEQ